MDRPLIERRVVAVFVGLQLCMVLSSLDGTIVATALPSITRDVGGFSRVTWVITAYAMAQVVAMPLYGKLGDVYGRKRILLSAVLLFLLGSTLCGLAQSMDQLLVARFIQGIGGGGIGTVAMAVTADIIPARQLGRWMGYQGMAFAVASVIGPVVGGLFVDHLSWRWAFLINLPVGAIGVAIIATQLRVPYRRLHHALDWLGAGVLMVALACFIVLTSLGGSELSWTSPTAVALMASIAVLVVLFIRHEQRAPEPVLPLRLFADRVIRTSAGVNFTAGLLLYCGIFFVPIFMQEVHGISPTSSGLVLTPVMFGAAFGTMISGRRVERSGHTHVWPVVGGTSSLAGVLLLTRLTATTPTVLAALFVLLVGLGAGFAMQPSLLAMQNAAPVEDLGTVTSTGLLFRMLGSTLGVPVFGGILNAGLAGHHRTPTNFAHALPPVFLAAVPVAAIGIVFALRTPERALRGHRASEPAHVLAEPYV